MVSKDSQTWNCIKNIKSLKSCLQTYIQSCQLFKKPWSEIVSGVCHTPKPWELAALHQHTQSLLRLERKIFFSDGFSSRVSPAVVSLCNSSSVANFGTPILFGVNRMSMQRIGLQMRSLAPSTVGEFEKERTRLGPKSDFFFFLREKLDVWRECVWKHAKVCVTRRNRESWQLCILYIFSWVLGIYSARQTTEIVFL